MNKNTVDYSKDPVLELKNYSGYGFKDISLKVYPGEILGVAGVVGAGRTEMAQTILEWTKYLEEKFIWMVTTFRTEHTESYESWCELRFRRQTCGWNFQDFIGCLQYYKRGVKRIFHGKSFLKPEERKITHPAVH